MKSAFWNVFFGLFFAALVLLGVDWLVREELLVRYVSIGDFFLMALAIFRLTRLVSYDIITQFIRNAVAGKDPTSFVGTFSALINCPWCTGLWFSFFVVFFYFAIPAAWVVILVLALAGLGSLFQVFANLIGWHAEGKKRQVLGPGETSVTKCG